MINNLNIFKYLFSESNNLWHFKTEFEEIKEKLVSDASRLGNII